MSNPSWLDDAKREAAAAAIEYVEDGMIVGLGTGSTAKHFVELLAEEMADGLMIRGVPTSEATRRLAESHGIPLIPVETVERIHLTVDGADEVDGHGRLIKGGGAALLREKIIAAASDHMIVIADETKKVEQLGRFPLPVEVTPFGYTITAKKVFDALCKAGVDRPQVTVREGLRGGRPLLTDGGNHIVDCHCGVIPDPERAAQLLSAIPGVVEHGLFIGIARTVIIGREDSVEIIEL